MRRKISKKEIRVIERLCNAGGNANVVQVLRPGDLTGMPLFVDMELRDMTLEDYIQTYIGARSASPEKSITCITASLH